MVFSLFAEHAIHGLLYTPEGSWQFTSVGSTRARRVALGSHILGFQPTNLVRFSRTNTHDTLSILPHSLPNHRYVGKSQLVAVRCHGGGAGLWSSHKLDTIIGLLCPRLKPIGQLLLLGKVFLRDTNFILLSGLSTRHEDVS